MRCGIMRLVPSFACSLALCVGLLVGLLGPSSARACLHPGGGGGGSTPLTEEGQQALILHHEGVEDLIVKVDYEGPALEEMAWILPVPTVPDHYGTADEALFGQLSDWANVRRDYRPRSKNGGGGGSSRASIVELPPAQAGPYAIQPIQARGAEAAEALVKWMLEHDYEPISAESLRYYTDRGWTFLAIRITPASGDTLPERGGLPPLHVRFASEQAIYPLKLSTPGSEFPVRIYLVTAETVEEPAFDGALQRGFEVTQGNRWRARASFRRGVLNSSVSSFAPEHAPEALQPLLGPRFGSDEELALTVLFCQAVNHTNGRWEDVEFLVSKWDEELAVPPLPAWDGSSATGPVEGASAAPGEKGREQAAGEAASSQADAGSKSSAESKSDKSGCSCASDGPPARPVAALGLLALLGLGARRRSRSRT